MSKPLVSVVMSAYNAEPFIEAGIRSVLQQTYPHVELIICDDGSTDQTAEIIKRYPSVRYVYQQNQGQGRGRNHAASRAQGRYLAFIDADDTWAPEKLEIQMAIFEANPEPGAVYCDMEIVDSNHKTLGYNARGRMKRGNIFNDLLSGNYMCGLSSLVVRTEIFHEVGGFSDHRYNQDFVFLLALAHKYNVDFSEKSLVYYLDHDSNISKKIDISYPEQISFYRQIPGLYALDATQRLMVQAQLKYLYFSYAVLHFRRKNFLQTDSILKEARSQGLLHWKARVLSSLNRPYVREYIYNHV